MAAMTTLGRAVPIVKAAVEDDDLREHARRAVQAGRAAILRPAPRPTRMRRAGLALREAGAAMNRAGARAEAQRRARRRALMFRGALVGSLSAAAAVALNRRPKEAQHV
jgi:hypothetical protein